ncbi:MAG: hypothetical protein IJV36_06955 [Prevotella sp.]|nr:hypothetical protein [Prevotella sp.]
MKKTSYIAPEMKVRSWNFENLLQNVSGGDIDVDNDPGDDEGTAKSDVLYNGGSVWED